MRASASDVRAASSRLRAAGAALRARPRAEIVRLLGALLERLRDPASAIRARLAAELPAATGFHSATLAAGLDAGFAPWTADAFAALVERELGGDPSRVTSGFPLTAVVLGGAIPMPSVLQLIAPLALASPVLARSGAHDPVTARAVLGELAQLDPQLGECVEVISFAHGDAEAMSALCEADCVVATGSDAAVAAIRPRTEPWQRFVGYGHRFSIAAIGREGDLSEACDAIARDATLWDQLGCLSPVALYAIGWSWEDRAGLLDELARAFANRAEAWPLVKLAPEHAATRANELATFELRAASGGGADLRRGRTNDWALLGEREPGFRGSPLGRVLRVHFVPDASALGASLAPVARHLASVGVAAFHRAAAAELAHRLATLGASRVCPAGQMQAPLISWCHDGQGVLTPLAALTSLEV